MKKIITIASIVLMIFLGTGKSYACGSWFGSHSSDREHSHQDGGDGAVGAPLDGGLLAILAAAGGAYFVARKKKKKGGD